MTSAPTTQSYDVVVVGGGPAGEHCAGALAQGGASVAVIERELVGGECSYWGCIPSKTLVRPGEAVAEALRAPGARQAITGDLDAGAALDWRDFMVSDYDDSSAVTWLASNGIDLHRGEGRLVGPGAVGVGDKVLRAHDVVVATGSDPFMPPIDGLDHADGVWTNREGTALKQLPRRLVILGGGPIGVETAQALASFGTQVSLVEGREYLLPREPRALGEALGGVLEADGIELYLGEHATRARRDRSEYVVTLSSGSELRGDRLMVATGRRARVHGIGLETVGIAPDARGIPVDARMASTPGIWAVGDVTGVWPLTYVGKYQARVAATNILGGHATASYVVPRVVFTHPQAAAVGEAEGPLSSTIPLSMVPRAATYSRNYERDPGFLTVVSDGARLTGAFALGPEAGEWIQQATVAIRARVPLDVLCDVIQPFPTFAEAFLYALSGLAPDRVPSVAAPAGRVLARS